jgi:tetratricopeptide (TPR) repeat protein
MSAPTRPLRRDTRIFISAVTRELGTIRSLVRKALEDNDYHAVEQTNFPPDYRDLVEKLRERIASCDAVLHIAGFCFGAEPPNRPADAPRRSYTQLEYDLARDLDKPVYVFLTGAGFPADPHDPEPDDLRALQLAHRERLASTGQDYNPIDSTTSLDQKVRSLQLKVQRLGDELRTVDEQVKSTDTRLRRRLVALAFLVVAVLGAAGYGVLRQQAEASAQRLEREQARLEREEQERERKAAEAARKEAETVIKIQRDFADRFLQQLLSNKEITPQDARQRALKELPALVKLPLPEIEALIDRRIVPKPGEPAPTPLNRARAALSQGDFDAVFRAADEQKQQDRELAMLEGTAALGRFRETPKPEWNIRALAAFQRAMALADPESPTEWEAWTDAAVSAASVLYDLARHREAEPILWECLRLREVHDSAVSPRVSLVLNNLAELLRATSRYSEAEPLYRRALTIDESSYGPEHPDVARDLNNLALLLKATNHYAEAEPLYRRALVIAESAQGFDDIPVAATLNNLAAVLYETSRYGDAEPLYRRALAIVESTYGPRHTSVVFALSNLAALLRTTDRTAEAEPLYRRALAIAEAAYLPDHPAVASRLNNLAVLLWETGRHADAEPLFRRAFAIAESSYGPDHPAVAYDLSNLAVLLFETDRAVEAERFLARAVGILSRFRRSTGHEPRKLLTYTESYHDLLTTLKYSDTEIANRIESVLEGSGPLRPMAPEVDRLLGPARPTSEVLAELDRAYRAEGKPPIWFLPPDQPINPHLDELLGPARPTAEVLADLDRQYKAEGKPPVWFLPLDEPVSPRLDELLGPSQQPSAEEAGQGGAATGPGPG